LPPDACDQAASHGFPLSDAEFLVLDARFHLSLAEASGNQVIAATMADLCSSSESYVCGGAQRWRRGKRHPLD